MYSYRPKYEQECRCKYRNTKRNEGVNTIHEPPVKDTSRGAFDNLENFTISGQFPPPEPPNGEHGLWELQFCKWLGWTWVRKSDGDKAPTRRKNDGNAQPVLQPQTQPPPTEKTSSKSKTGKGKSTAKKKQGGGCLSFCNKKKEEQPYQPAEHESSPRLHGETSGTRRSASYAVQVGEPRGKERPQTDVCCCCCCQVHAREMYGRNQNGRKSSECQTWEDVQDQGVQICELGDPYYPCPYLPHYCLCESPRDQSEMCVCMTCPQACCVCDQTPNEPREERRRSIENETQTQIEMREKATKVSETCVAAKQPVANFCCQCNRPKRRPMCMLPVCCSARPVNRSCPCAEKGCIAKPDCKSTGTCCRCPTNKIVNYCLTQTPNPKLNNLFKFKTNNFSTMSKSLDLLVKNNINVMHLLGNKKFAKDDKIPNFLDSNISSLSIDESVKKSDPEHRSLLTAVCDAILSSHKFDEENYNPLKFSVSHATEKSYESRDSANSYGLLETILNDLNFPMNKTRNDTEMNFLKDAGVQVNNFKKTERSQIARPVRRPPSRSKSKTATLPSCVKKCDYKSYTDIFKTKRSEKRNVKHAAKPQIFSYLSRNEDRQTSKSENDKSLTTIFKSSDDSIIKTARQIKQDLTSSENRTSKLRNIDALLSTIPFNFKNVPSASNRILEENYVANLLDTTPSFAEFDIPHSVEKKNGRTSFKKDRGSD